MRVVSSLIIMEACIQDRREHGARKMTTWKWLKNESEEIPGQILARKTVNRHVGPNQMGKHVWQWAANKCTDLNLRYLH